MATLPVMGYGGRRRHRPARARLQARWGRKRIVPARAGRPFGKVLTAAGGAVAVSLGSFWLRVAATGHGRLYNANAQLYLVCRAELVAPEHKAQAISFW